MLDGTRLWRFSAAHLEELAPPVALGSAPRAIVVGYSASSVDAVAVGEARGATLRLNVRNGPLEVEPLELADHERVVAVHGHRVLVYGKGVLRAIDRGRSEAWRTRNIAPRADEVGASRSRSPGDVVGASVILGGRAMVVLVRGTDVDHAAQLR